jgi:hypothetical protein
MDDTVIPDLHHSMQVEATSPHVAGILAHVGPNRENRTPEVLAADACQMEASLKPIETRKSAAFEGERDAHAAAFDAKCSPILSPEANQQLPLANVGEGGFSILQSESRVDTGSACMQSEAIDMEATPSESGSGITTSPTPGVAALQEDTTIKLHKEVFDMALQIEEISAAVRPHKTLLLRKVEQVARLLWPSCRVESFGSFATHLDLPGSDVDCVVCGVREHHASILESQPSLPLTRLQEVLSSLSWVVSAYCVPQAAMPVIKVLAQSEHANSASIRIDITFDAPNHRGLPTAAFICHAARQYPALTPLSLIFKHLLVTQNLNEPYLGGLCSYGVVLLVMAVLQRYPNSPHLAVESPELSRGHLPIIATTGMLKQSGPFSSAASATTQSTCLAGAPPYSTDHVPLQRPWPGVSRFQTRPPIQLQQRCVSDTSTVGALSCNQTESALAPGVPGSSVKTVAEPQFVNLGTALVHVLELTSRLCANAKYWALDVTYGVLYRRGLQHSADPLVIVDPIERSNNVGRSAWGFDAVNTTLMGSVRRLASRRFEARTSPHLLPNLLGAVFGAQHHNNVVLLIRQVWLKQSKTAVSAFLPSAWHRAFQHEHLPLNSTSCESQSLALHRAKFDYTEGNLVDANTVSLLKDLLHWHLARVARLESGLPDGLHGKLCKILQTCVDSG